MADAISETKPLTKSQKKRMKRKNKSAKAAGSPAQGGDDVSVASSVASQPKLNESPANNGVGASAAQMASQLNPIDKMRADIMKLGYTFQEVEAAMSEMWELELPYDEFDAVLGFLKAKSNDHDSSNIPAKQNGSDINEGDSLTMEMTASLEAFTPDSKTSLGCARDPTPTALEKRDERIFSESALETEGNDELSFTGATTGSSDARSARVNLPFIAKLEIVAAHENIHDATYAITEWVSKLSKGQEAAIICAESSAMPTTIRRAVVDCSESDYAKLLPYLLNLLCLVFPPANISKAVYRDGLTKVLNAAKKAAIASADAPDQNIGEKIATILSKALSNVISGQALASSDPVRPTVVSSKQQNELGRLLQRRETQKYAATQAFASSAYTHVGINGNSSKQDRTIFEQSDVDLDYFFSTNKTMHEKVSLDMDVASDLFARNKATTEEALKSCEMDRAKVSSQKEALLAEIRALEDQENALLSQAAELASSLEGLSVTYNEQKAELQEKIKVPKKVMKIIRACNSVDEVFSSFEKSLSKPIIASTQREQDPMDFFQTMLNYFNTEAELYNFLSSRVNVLCERADKIEREMIECRNLGLSTNAAQLESAIAEVTAFVTEDKRVLDLMQLDLRTMKASMVEGTRDFFTHGIILPGHSKIMHQIRKVLVSLNLNNEDFSSLIPEGDEVDLCEHPVVLDETWDGSLAPMELPSSNLSTTFSAPAPVPIHLNNSSNKMPKLSWAAVSAAPKFPGKSLREIQDEERTSGRA